MKKIKISKGQLICFVSGLAFCGTAFADITVKSGVELAAAFDSAKSGDTIFLEPGTYDLTKWTGWGGNASYHLYTGTRKLTLEGKDATSWRDNGSKTKAVIKCDLTADNGGKRILGFAADITLKNLTFDGAYKTQNAPALYRNGSGLATVTNCVFVSNRSTGNGGAVNVAGVFQDCLFDSNRSDGGRGGAIFCDQSDGTLKLVGCSFTNDYTTANQGQGGAIYQSAGTVEIVDCSFESCVGNGGYTAAGYRTGGAIQAAGGTTSLSNVIFKSCTAPYSGGAIVGGASLVARHCTFTSCNASERGGAVSGGTYYDCIFDSNSSWRGGAAVNISGAYGCVFTNNYCGGSLEHTGGSVFHDSASESVFNGCTFVGSKVTVQKGLGGAIYQSAGTIRVENTTFDSCSATGGYTNPGYQSGGAICENGGMLEVVDSVFTNCTAVQQLGGAIYAKSGSVMVRGSMFACNRAADSGAIQCNDATFITNCTFVANTASSTGGAVRDCTNIVDCAFADNASAYYSGHCRNCVVRNSRFSGLGTVCNSRCVNCVFDGARTTDADDYNRGLIIAVNQSPYTAKCVNCLFVNCDCFYMLQSWGLPLSIVNCTFADNKANSYFAYGADYNGQGTGARFDFTNCIFNGSRTDHTGHGLQVNIQSDSTGIVNVDHCVAETVELPATATRTELTTAKARFVGADHYSGAPAYTPKYGDRNVVGKGELLDWTDDDVDLAGNRRLRNDLVSLGCYEPWYERRGFLLIAR